MLPNAHGELLASCETAFRAIQVYNLRKGPFRSIWLCFCLGPDQGRCLGLGLGLEPAHNFMAANNFATFRKVFNENSHKLCLLDEEGSVNTVRAPVDVAAGKYTSLITRATVNERSRSAQKVARCSSVGVRRECCINNARCKSESRWESKR